MPDAAEPIAAKQELEFDTVQTAAGSTLDAGVPTCKECHRPIAERYYEVLGHTICERCRGVLADKFSGRSSAGQLLRAALYGAGAAALGAALYYAVRAITGWEIGIIAIAVGWLVGRAVQRGGAGGSGWKYQALAVGLTYLAIASSYVPTLIEEFNGATHKALTQADRRPAGDSAAAARPVAEGAPATVATRTSADTAAKAAAAKKPITFAGFLGGLVVLTGLLLAFPILANVLDMPSGILGLIILYIGLLQAWRMNKRIELVFAGPFQVGGSTQSPAASA